MSFGQGHKSKNACTNVTKRTHSWVVCLQLKGNLVCKIWMQTVLQAL